MASRPLAALRPVRFSVRVRVCVRVRVRVRVSRLRSRSRSRSRLRSRDDRPRECSAPIDAHRARAATRSRESHPAAWWSRGRPTSLSRAARAGGWPAVGSSPSRGIEVAEVLRGADRLEPAKRMGPVERGRAEDYMARVAVSVDCARTAVAPARLGTVVTTTPPGRTSSHRRCASGCTSGKCSTKPPE